jgi:hypothetical protein
MSSKYDVYWQGRLEEIARILREAYENGRSSEIDVSDIRDYGERMSWYGVVNVYRDVILRNEMAHARSLGRIALENRLLRPYEEAGFRLVITKNLRLHAERLSLPPVPPSQVPFPQAPSPLVQPQVYTSIHEIIEPLPLNRYPISKRDLPDNGLYLFYEEGERFHADDQARDRIARVGTHREQDRLPDRISIHFHGDKNSSVFRRHLGGAIIRRENPSDPRLQQWLEQDTPTFADIEEKVSRELQEHFRFRCVKVEDRNERIELEERLIATLAKCSTYHPSHNWLGLFAISEKIRESGMWNEQHVDSERCIRPGDLSRLEELVCNSDLHEPSIELCLELLNLPQRRDILELLRKQDKYTLNLKMGFGNVRDYIEEIVETLSNIHNINISGIIKFSEKTRKLEEQAGLSPSVTVDLNFLWIKTSVYLHRRGRKVPEEQQKQIWQVLQNYIIHNNITHVWSLLPDSDTPQSPTPYHRVFNDLWKRLKNTKTQCFHVEVPSAGTGTGYKRAEWLREILNTNHDYLIGQPFPPTQLRGIAGYSFRYNPC